MTRGNQRDVNRQRAEKRKDKVGKAAHSTLAQREVVNSVICGICRQSFMCTVNRTQLEEHVFRRHPKNNFEDCFKSSGEEEQASN